MLAVGLYGIYEHEQQQQINDLAEIDAAVLVDELPPDAYVDNGFNAYLNKGQQTYQNRKLRNKARYEQIRPIQQVQQI